MANDENPAGSPEDDFGDLPDTWKPESVKGFILAERTLNPEETSEELARRLINENVTTAVLGIVHIATHGSNERVRLDAQKYITERALGRVGDDAFVENPMNKFIKSITEYVDANAAK